MTHNFTSPTSIFPSTDGIFGDKTQNFSGDYDVETLKELVTRAGVQPVVGLCYPVPTDENKKGLWTLEKICGTQNQVRIKNQATGEYLYSASCDPCRDFGLRKVFTWAEPSTIPDSHPEIWRTTADWVVGRDYSGGNTLKSVRHNEYLFATTDKRAFSEVQRSVFTKSIYSGLGQDGLWRFSKNVDSFLTSPKVRVLADVEIVNMSCEELLKSGSISGLFGSIRRTVYTEKKHGPTFVSLKTAPSSTTFTDSNGQVRTVLRSEQQMQMVRPAQGPDDANEDGVDVYDIDDSGTNSENPNSGLSQQLSVPLPLEEVN